MIKRKIEKLDLYYPLKIYNIVTEIAKRIAYRRTNGPLTVHSYARRVGNPRLSIDFNNELFTLRISTGCLGKCSYCNIKRAIGPLKSKPIWFILDELKKGIASKKFRLNLVASDTGSYGLDIGATFPQLLDAILVADSRIIIQFIQDLHPKWLYRYKDDLIRIVGTKRIRSILTAVQSGSERILRLMNRCNHFPEYRRVIDAMKKAYPGLRLRSQVIVGFPTETEEDLLDTINFIKKCKFDEIDIFHYYETPTMDSAKIYPKVPEDLIRERIVRLYDALPVSMVKRPHQVINQRGL